MDLKDTFPHIPNYIDYFFDYISFRHISRSKRPETLTITYFQQFLGVV